ncbi:cyclic pyranopterin monophosphate synthase MoaC [Modicisalibacter sp. 'Wilcox']|uniref:cyclic pyranopterin monophosphate synthase MoaC n=1 Tax=Modicisalibacter sp. 'Wilcox' TaxID=2679914 RepID=UPI0013D1176A|nr:cyclic pyranopterin monophosphate synthase MoaC [Modicisalibacter sp. 'Wilcox']
MSLTHLNARGEAHMVDVGDKPVSQREAVASGRIYMQAATLARLEAGGMPKGDVLATARIAGIQAAKRTHELIPLCHALALTKVSIDFHLDAAAGCVEVRALCRLAGRTGVEMEALTATSVACLTLYDMCKAVDKDMVIGDIRLESKRGGKSGDYRRPEAEEAPSPLVTAEAAGHGIGMAARSAQPCIQVKCLAELRERLGVGEVAVLVDELPSNDVAGLKAALTARDPRFALLAEQRVLCAVNQVMSGEQAQLTDGDEVAFFPPVTGG